MLHLPGGNAADDVNPAPARDAAGPVVFYRCGDAEQPRGHEIASKMAIAGAVAELLGRGYAGDFDGGEAYDGAPYFVPSETLGLAQTRRLGIRDEHDLFGGTVPFPFVATKVISHDLPHPDAAAPEGWAREFGSRVEDVVLPGFSAFSRPDAVLAGTRLLATGAVRMKQPDGIGGRGQVVIRDRRQLESELDRLDPEALARHGIVLERNLADVATFSVGQARLAGLLITYCGTQRLTRANDGRDVYGGSRLLVARGDWRDLLALELAPAIRAAIGQARVYHEAALATYSGMFASRSNYDVAQGRDDTGTLRSGVLEQSWRIGGATGAELAAVKAFQAAPSLQSVQASTSELYGDCPELPEDAVVYFNGIDDRAGPLVKFARLDRHADS